MTNKYGIASTLAATLALVTACATGVTTSGGLDDLDGDPEGGGGGIDVDASGIKLDTDGSSVAAQPTGKDAGNGDDLDAGATDAPSIGLDGSSTNDSGDSSVALDASKDAGCTVVTENLLANPSFDVGTTPWVQSEASLIFQAPSTITAQTAPDVGWMGDANNATQTLYQAIAIPANATALRVKGYKWIATEDAAGFDFLKIQTRTSAGVVLDELESYSPDESASDTKWVAFDVAAPTAHAGQTIELAFVATTDDSLNTNFFLDTMEVDVTYCKY